MSFGLALLAYAALSGGAQNAVPAPAAASAESVTVTAARRWLALVDSGNWPDSWQATAQSFRALNTLAVWQSASEGGRVPLGAMLSRSLLDELDVPVPPAGAQVVRFRTDFANKPGALEKISLVREDGGWKVVGYTIE